LKRWRAERFHENEYSSQILNYPSPKKTPDPSARASLRSAPVSCRRPFSTISIAATGRRSSAPLSPLWSVGRRHMCLPWRRRAPAVLPNFSRRRDPAVLLVPPAPGVQSATSPFLRRVPRPLVFISRPSASASAHGHAHQQRLGHPPADLPHKQVEPLKNVKGRTWGGAPAHSWCPWWRTRWVEREMELLLVHVRKVSDRMLLAVSLTRGPCLQCH
jgi:hypothetical protein